MEVRYDIHFEKRLFDTHFLLNTSLVPNAFEHYIYMHMPYRKYLLDAADIHHKTLFRKNHYEFIINHTYLVKAQV